MSPTPLYFHASVWTFLFCLSFSIGHQLFIETEEMKFEKVPKLRIQIQLGGMESETPSLEEIGLYLCGGHS